MTLYDIRDSHKRLESIKERLLRLRSAAELGARKLQLVPGGCGAHDRIASTLAKIDELERELVDATAELEEGLQAVEIELERLPARHREVMRLRYIDGLSWRQVSRRLHYSIDWCFELHREALKYLKYPVKPS